MASRFVRTCRFIPGEACEVRKALSVAKYAMISKPEFRVTVVTKLPSVKGDRA